MDGERITLRLEGDDIDIIDRYIDESADISNRSQLARRAIRSYISGTSSHVSPGSDNTISIEVPGAAKGAIEAMVRSGIYKSMGEAIEDCVRKQFITEEYIEEVKRRAFEESKEILHKVSD
ncbi:MAG: hypothetical protein ACLFUV_08800 [Methanomassiliicoccales archaeon]